MTRQEFRDQSSVVGSETTARASDDQSEATSHGDEEHAEGEELHLEVDVGSPQDYGAPNDAVIKE